jgi:transitional endoplasmic reticulum ATPase
MPRPNVPDQLIEEVEALHERRQGYRAGSFQEALATVIDMATPGLVEEVGLIVTKAYPDDSGLNVARLHPETLQRLNLEPGRPIRITGERTTVATAEESKKTDLDQATVRLDGFVRQNAGTEVDQCVRIERAEAVSPARRVSFELPETGVEELGTEASGLIRRQVADRFVSAGDVVPVVADSGSGGPAIPLTVVETEPDGPVVVQESTEIGLEEPEQA